MNYLEIAFPELAAPPPPPSPSTSPHGEPGERTPYPCLACGAELDPERLFCGDGCMADYRAGVRAFRPRPAALCRHGWILWDSVAHVPRCGECRAPRPGAKAQVKR